MIFELTLILLVVALLMAAGVCPLTLQLVMLAAVLTMLVREQRRALLTTVERFQSDIPGVSLVDGAVTDDFSTLPSKDSLAIYLSSLSAGTLKGAVSIADQVSSTPWTLPAPNHSSSSIIVGSQALTGPSSQQSGVFSDFTICATVAIPEGATMTVLTVAGLLRGSMSSIRLAVQPGAVGGRQVKLVCGGSDATADFSGTSDPVTIMVRRAGNNIFMSQTIHAIEPSTEKYSTTVQDNSRITPDVTTPMTIGDGGVIGGEAHLKRLIIWSKSLSDDATSAVLRRAWTVELLQQPTVAGIVSSLDQARSDVSGARSANPYGSDVIQNACSRITDWTLPDAVAMADKACWTAISAHCQSNPSAPGCGCWDPSKSGTASCVAFRSQLSEPIQSSPPTYSPTPPKKTTCNKRPKRQGLRDMDDADSDGSSDSGDSDHGPSKGWWFSM